MRSPWQRNLAWSSQEAAEELHRRRTELIGQLRRRSESRGVPLPAQAEIVDDAITAVVMSPRAVVNEHHLIGAFWLAVDHRCWRYREGRHFARLGSRVRVEFDAAMAQATGSVNPFDRLELRDRFARAADLMADLSQREREVVAVMATYGVGAIPAARLLHLPLGEVRSAARSASAKLDRVAAIAAAGRMCEFRLRAIQADAAGAATDHDVLADEQRVREFLDEQAALAKWYTLIGTQQAVFDLREEISFFKKLAGEVRKIATPVPQASAEAEQAVRQFMSKGLAVGEVIKTLALADQDRPDISVLSEEFLDSIAAKTEHPNIQIRLLKKLLKNEVKSRSRTNQAQAKLFAEQLDAVLHRYELRQISSAEVVQRLVEIARSLREAGRRHKQLGLTAEEAAFYDALAGGADAPNVDPQLAKIARDLVKSIREDLTVDWADRASTEAAIRRKIRRLLREHEYKPPVAPPGGESAQDINHFAQLVLDQAKTLYRYWPDVEGRLFE